jgi:hypothetical protein
MTARKSARFRVGHDPARIPPFTGRHSLFPPSSAHKAISVPHGAPAVAGSLLGLPCFASVSERVGPFLFADGNLSTMACVFRDHPHRIPFGSSLSARLACQSSRRLSEVHVCWSSPLIPSSSPPSCWQIPLRLTAWRTDSSAATLSPELHTELLPAPHVWVGNG